MDIYASQHDGHVVVQNAVAADDVYYRFVKVIDELQKLGNQDVDAILDRYGVRYLPRFSAQDR